MSVAGIDMVGPPPADLTQHHGLLQPVLARVAQQADAATALIRFLHSPEACRCSRRRDSNRRTRRKEPSRRIK